MAMTPRFFLLLSLISPWIALTNAFSTREPSILPRRQTKRTTTTSLAYSVHDEDKPIQCFLIFSDDDKDDSPPRVVCTTQPDEYAWFNGIDRENLVETNEMYGHALVEGTEGASPRGVPEWECESAFQ